MFPLKIKGPILITSSAGGSHLCQQTLSGTCLKAWSGGRVGVPPGRVAQGGGWSLEAAVIHHCML